MIEDLTLIAPSARRGLQIARFEGSGWRVTKVLTSEDVRCVAVAHEKPRVWFAGTQGRGVHQSMDGGQTWTPIGPTGTIVKSIGTAPDAIFAGTKPAQVYVSRDRGDTWNELESFQRIPGRRLWWSPAESPGTAYVQSLAVSPSDPNVILAGIELGAVVRSADGGETWSRHLKGTLRDCHSMHFHHSDGDWAYEAGGTGGGASFSKDGGATWSKAKEGLDRKYAVACAADPVEPDLWYISASTGPGKAHTIGRANAHIYRKRGAEPWVKLNGGLPQPFDSMPYGLATVPGRPGLAIAALKNGQVWATLDHGENWVRLEIDLGQVGLGLSAIPDIHDSN